jgi:hypothetical protein
MEEVVEEVTEGIQVVEEVAEAVEVGETVSSVGSLAIGPENVLVVVEAVVVVAVAILLEMVTLEGDAHNPECKQYVTHTGFRNTFCTKSDLTNLPSGYIQLFAASSFLKIIPSLVFVMKMMVWQLCERLS